VLKEHLTGRRIRLADTETVRLTCLKTKHEAVELGLRAVRLGCSAASSIGTAILMP
jgi:hypothetical protein